MIKISHVSLNSQTTPLRSGCIIQELGESQQLVVIADGIYANELLENFAEKIRPESLAIDNLTKFFSNSHELTQLLIQKGKVKGEEQSNWYNPGSLLTLSIEDPYCNCGWIGSPKAFLVREGKVVAETVEHTLYRNQVRHGIKSNVIRRNVLMRNLGGSIEFSKPDFLDKPWKLIPGDLVFAVSSAVTDLIVGKQLPFESLIAEDLNLEQFAAKALKKGASEVTISIIRKD